MNFETVIIDDDEVILVIFKKMMLASQFHDAPRLFSKSKEGIDYLLQQQDSTLPCVIFLDINMPLMSGWDILDAIEDMSQQRSIYVILVTASSNMADKQNALKYQSIISFFVKPLLKKDFEELKDHPKLAHLFKAS